MSYIVQQEVKGRQYYYLVQNARHGTRWVKAKKYLGSRLPGKQELRGYEADLQKKLDAKKKGRVQQIPRYFEYRKFLKNQEKSRIDHICQNGQSWINEDNDIDFMVKFIFNSNAIEGSTNSLKDTRKMLKEEKVPRGKRLRDIYEAVNTEDAYRFVKNYEKDLSRKFILRLHEILMHRLRDDAGIFRDKPVKITGTEFIPPRPEDVEHEVRRFLSFYKFIKKKYHPIEQAALAHIKFVQLHPFGDGNGRVGRLILNFILMKNNYYPIVIGKKDQQEYYRLLERTHSGEYEPFVRFVYDQVLKEYDSDALDI